MRRPLGSLRLVRGTLAGTIVALSAALLVLPSGASTAAGDDPVHTVSVSGEGVGMYPAFDPGTERYALTTTAATEGGSGTDGTVTVTATTSDPAGRVLVQGRPATGAATTVTGLEPGDEVSVIIDDAGGTAVHALVYLPPAFPALQPVVDEPGQAPGSVLLTFSRYGGAQSPAIETALDHNAVPRWLREAEPGGGSADLKAAPGGHWSVFRSPTPATGRTGAQLVELDEQFREVRRMSTQDLVDTDMHDAVLRADGSRILLAYEPNAATGLTDAVIQEVDATGDVVFTWNSADHLDPSETTNTPGAADYAHINSVEELPGGDLLASFRHTSSVMRIAWSDHDGFTRGDVVWRLGGRRSDFTFVDDPYRNGPCAQHTAGRLPNGNILIYDNGSNRLAGNPSYCVDPDDPTGPTVDRPQTRVTEYALDEEGRTATLVWQYLVPNRFSYFAGSVRRLPNGNTLVGWASYAGTTVTEVTPDKTAVWELPNTEGLYSYRAAKAVVPDAIAPEVAALGPANGATYVEGAVVRTDRRCTDRGGSSLVSCVAPATLDTSTPGRHTWSVTGTDGAGNTTTVRRSYTVAAAYRPDAQVRRPGRSWVGNDVRGSSARQQVARNLPRAGAQRTVLVRLQNDGRRAERLFVTGVAGNRRFAVRYYAGSADVTRRMVAGRWLRTAELRPGGYVDLRVVVTRLRAARPGDDRSVRLVAMSAHERTRRDAVAAVVRAPR